MTPERLYRVVCAPLISEKATLVAESSNQVVFKVVLDASKAEIKKAVEKLFSVKVSQVRTMRVKGKRKLHKRFILLKKDKILDI